MKRAIAVVSIALLMFTLFSFNACAEDSGIKLTVEQASMSIDSGETASYIIYIYNGHESQQTVILYIEGVTGGWSAILSNNNFALDGKNSTSVYLNVTSSDKAESGASSKIDIDVSTQRGIVEDSITFTTSVQKAGVLTVTWNNLETHVTTDLGSWTGDDEFGRNGEDVALKLKPGVAKDFVVRVAGKAGTFSTGFTVINVDATPYFDYWDFAVTPSTVTLSTALDVQTFNVNVKPKTDIDIGHYVSFKGKVIDGVDTQETLLKKWVMSAWANYTIDLATTDDMSKGIGEGEYALYNFTLYVDNDVGQTMSINLNMVNADSTPLGGVVFSDWDIIIRDMDTNSVIMRKSPGETSFPSPYSLTMSPDQTKSFRLEVSSTSSGTLGVVITARLTVRDYDELNFTNTRESDGLSEEQSNMIIYGMAIGIVILVAIAMVVVLRGRKEEIE